jgi:hypothetical protein
VNPAANRAVWAGRFRAAAGLTLGAGGVGGAGGVVPGDAAGALRVFADEAGHRRAVDGPFLGWCWGIKGMTVPGGERAGAAGWWWALHDEAAAGRLARELVEEVGGAVPPMRARGRSVEVDTEEQLSALHAMTHLLGREARVMGRVVAGVRWLMEHLQPDNATSHPWGCHAFVLAAEQMGRTEGEEALLYAGTLLSNAQVQLGRPDRFSAWILWDAARVLEGRG